jgi:hypothetical protein
MAWDASYALDGIFLFGGPLNVHDYVIDTNSLGESTEEYHVVHFLLDDDREVERRLAGTMQTQIAHIFPVFYLLRRSMIANRTGTNLPPWVQEMIIFKPWLHSLGRDFVDTNHGLAPWGPGPTLSIGCNKKDNPQIKPDR